MFELHLIQGAFHDDDDAHHIQPIRLIPNDSNTFLRMHFVTHFRVSKLTGKSSVCGQIQLSFPSSLL
jgi:hypothetical protein